MARTHRDKPPQHRAAEPERCDCGQYPDVCRRYGCAHCHECGEPFTSYGPDWCHTHLNYQGQATDTPA